MDDQTVNKKNYVEMNDYRIPIKNMLIIDCVSFIKNLLKKHKVFPMYTLKRICLEKYGLIQEVDQIIWILASDNFIIVNDSIIRLKQNEVKL